MDTGREAGSWQQDAVEAGIASMYCEPMGGYGDNYPATITLEGNVYLHDTGYVDSITVYMADIGTSVAHYIDTLLTRVRHQKPDPQISLSLPSSISVFLLEFL